MKCYCTISKYPSSTKADGCDAQTGLITCVDNVQHCFVSFTKRSQFQSCWDWPDNTNTACPSNEGICFYTKNNSRNHACCCKGNLCNNLNITMTDKSQNNVKNRISPIKPTELFKPTSQSSQQIHLDKLPAKSRVYSNGLLNSNLPIAFGILTVVIIITSISFLFFSKKKLIKTVYATKVKSKEICFNNNNIIYNSIVSENKTKLYNNFGNFTKIRQIGIGKFGQIWLANSIDLNHLVALKLFSKDIEGYKSWKNEVNIYSILINNPHENILKFYGSFKIDNSNSNDYVIALDYHATGSLNNYLKCQSLSWTQLLNLCLSIARGVNHLHYFSNELSIAHCDIKSKNILLKEDLTACLADFGLSLYKSQESKVKYQMGTCQYMAPEILQGSINLTLQAFLQVDIYSMSLVFWEMLNRCQFQESTHSDNTMDDSVTSCASCYKQPFDDYFMTYNIGMDNGPVSMETMRQIVVIEHCRPKFNLTWHKYPAVIQLWNTLEECWDDDPDARITSGCVIKRISFLCNQN